LATKQIIFSFTFHWPSSKEPSPSPSIGHQKNNLLLHLPLATKLWIYLHLPSISLLKADSDHQSFFFLGHNFQFNLENTCSCKLIEEENND
jgi:hypothetical protein